MELLITQQLSFYVTGKTVPYYLKDHLVDSDSGKPYSNQYVLVGNVGHLPGGRYSKAAEM
jgi:hypothetical protein